jgi:uncharacterized membrane protein
MALRNPRSTAQIMGHPIHPMLIPFPIAFLVATLVCDLVFWRTGNPGWATASLYLLGAALVMPRSRLYTGWRGWEMVYRDRVAVAETE